MLIPFEIKSAETFSMDFIKGLERFQALGVRRGLQPVPLCNGKQQINVRGTRIFNPLLIEDIWETLILPLEQADS